MRAGVNEADSALIAHCLVDAERRGHSSHGIDLLETYVARIRAGGIRTDRRPSILSGNGAIIRIDAQGGPGQIAADMAAQMVAERAAGLGLAAVAVRNNNHVGMLAAYRQHFQSAGVIGLLLNISGPALTPPRGRGLALGSNAVCLVVPRPEGSPFCIDFGTGMVSLGKIRAMLHTSSSAPDGWLLDSGGKPTQDLSALAEGGSVPLFGGYKGLCVSLIVELLAGALAADTISPQVHKQRVSPERPMGCSQLFVAFSPSHFGMPDMESALDGLRAAVMRSYVEPLPDLWFPDQMEDTTMAATEDEIDLPSALAEYLMSIDQSSSPPAL